MTRSLLLLPVLGLSLLACPASAQQAYPTPEAAAEALVGALGSERADPAQLATVLGPDWGRYILLDNVDRDDTDAFIARYREKHLIQQSDPGRAVLAVGKEGWTLPIPLVKGADGWAFDLAAGEPELRARRIGRNELDATAPLMAVPRRAMVED